MTAQRQEALNDNDSDAVIIGHDDISNYNPQQILPESPETLQKIRGWLKPTAYNAPGGEYEKHLTSHVQGTGTWLTSNETYEKWLRGSEEGFLWIQGIPGSGKSVIAANLIHTLSTSNPGAPVLFFFFRQIINANHKPQALLRDWLDQLLSYSPPLQKELKGYIDAGRSIESLSTESLWKDLHMAFSYLPGKVFCVADALDEMDGGNESFLQELASLGSFRPEKVKVLVTSRPVPNVGIPLRKSTSLQVRLEEKLVDVDISIFVQSALSGSNIPLSDQELIENAVPGRANGLFLYAKLAMDAFLEPNADIQQVIQKLPTDLNVLYTDLLVQHAQRSGVPPSVQHLILQAVTHATRSLRLLELAEMIRSGNPDHSSRDLRATKELIRAACGPLLEILADETISVIHHSFTEYLNGTTRSSNETGYPVLQPAPTHASLALECLRYLQSGDWGNYSIICVGGIPPPETSLFGLRRVVDVPEKEAQLRLQHPFFHYAARNWHRHVRKSENAGFDQYEINTEIRRFLGQEMFKESQIHIAAKLGLASYAQDVLLGDIDPNIPDQDGLTPMWLAASKGHAEMIRVLVAAGANPDQENASSGLKPLHEAATHNHHLVVQALLEAGVDPLTPKTKDSAFSCGSRRSTIGHTPLMYACHNGHVKSVEVFLSFLKDITTIHQALVWASEMSKSEVVARILQHPGVDPNTRILGDTPLFRACAYPDLGTVQVLLDAGADPTLGSECRRDRFGWFDSNDSQNKPQTYNCLHRLCGLGVHVPSNPRKALESDLCEILRLLVESGIDIHERTPRGQTALHGAVRSVGMTRALIEAGADVNAVDSLGNTPLYNVKSSEVLQILAEHGHANIETINAKEQTPLHFMLTYFAHEPSGIDSIVKFITYGPNCNIPDGDGNRPLHIALQPTYPKAPLIQALLHGGADPNLKNARGVSPLLSTRLSPELLPVINMLLDAGADINAVDNNGETLLFGGLTSFSFEKDEDRCIKAFIERGADIAVRDLAGRTILHATARTHAFSQDDTKSTYGCKKLDFLVSLGLDLQAIDSMGNTLLHELSERARVTSSLDHGHSMVNYWSKLVANGLDVDQKNHAGRTALHILSATDANWLTTELGPPSPIDFVISKTQEIDSPDEDGITPLHLAAAGSVSNTTKLLDAGADPTLATHEGLTALHLACRARQSNTVGLLLRSLRSKLGQSALDPSFSSTAGVNAKAKGDFDYLTPLFYACQSGQPETVALLIEAGADINEHALKGCAGFEDENALWLRHDGPLKGPSLFGASPFTVKETPTPTNIFSKVSRAGTSPTTVPYINPVKLEDTARPTDEGSSLTSDIGTGVTARLEEILDMLLSRQSATLLPFLHGFIDEAMRDQKAYTARCFSDALKRYRDRSELEGIVETANSDDSDTFKAETRLLESTKPGESNQELFKKLIHQRQYQAVNELARRKADFLTIPEGTVDCNFSVLVKNGISSLVKTIGDIETKSRLAGGQWHAFGDKTRPGLWSEGNTPHDLCEIKTEGTAYLVQAVSRQLPNMAVVQLLVEHFQVDINEFEYQRQRVNNESIVVPANSALHQVAHGHTWWQTFQALPYLLKAGANIEIRNFKGQTPLLLALEEISTRPGLFQKHVIKSLLEWGADVNAIDNAGNSCLSYANKDINLLKSLMKRGATASTRAVFAAIEQLRVDALEAFLEAGFDPNTKRTDEPPQGLGSSLFGKRSEPRGSTEDLPIYYACLKLQGFSGPPDSQNYKKETEVVQMLLKYGADPFAKFLVKTATPYSNPGVENKTAPSHGDTASRGVPEGYEERMVLHELMRRGEPPNILLGIEALEINRQDAQGRTLLHLACQNNPDQVTTADQEGADNLTRFQKLVSLGATLEARDNFGRNILHYLVDRDVYLETPKLTLGHILDKAPHLVLQSDNAGNTPLHKAVRLAAFRRHTDTAETLLSTEADALAVTKNGDNMLHLLATKLDTPELRTLFHDLARRGVDINARNSDGQTALFAFSKRRKKRSGGLFGGGSGGLFGKPQREYSEDGALQLFQNLGADFSVRNDKGQGLLHIAAPGDVGRFKELLSMGLDPMLEDDAHQTPIDVAAACGNQDILALFEKKN